jgi:serine/threonine protein phosphatase PrpC
VIEIGTDPVCIGRDPQQCNLVLSSADDLVSKRHCRVRYDLAGRCFLLEDLGSSNGTFAAGGDRIAPGRPRPLFPGDRSYPGHARMHVRGANGRRRPARRGGTMTLTSAGRSRVGGRAVNEDAWGATDAALACWVLADGLGGHGGGEQASRIAVDTVLAAAERDTRLDAQCLHAYVAAAHEEIRRAQRDGNAPGMHTTLAIAITDRSEVLWAHVGDTRIYYFRDGALLYQTADHSVPQMLVMSGEITAGEIRDHPDRSRLLRALGQEALPRASVSEHPERLKTGDAVLLCTDGWWEHVTETEMEVDLAKSRRVEEWLDWMEDRIMARVNGDHDNFSAIAVFIGAGG